MHRSDELCNELIAVIVVRRMSEARPFKYSVHGQDHHHHHDDGTNGMMRVLQVITTPTSCHWHSCSSSTGQVAFVVLIALMVRWHYLLLCQHTISIYHWCFTNILTDHWGKLLELASKCSSLCFIDIDSLVFGLEHIIYTEYSKILSILSYIKGKCTRLFEVKRLLYRLTLQKLLTCYNVTDY